MAAGKGTRMNNPDLAKVMYPVGGKPMVEHVALLAEQLHAQRIVVIVGWQRESVIAHLEAVSPEATTVVQDPQLGTGHAVMQTTPALEGFAGDLLVLSGDVPLLRLETVKMLVDVHRRSESVATVLTTVLEDPTGYGRILRDSAEKVTGIVEQKDATDAQKAIREINTGIYLFRKDELFEGLSHITPNNAQKEYYLTDVFRTFWNKGLGVSAVVCGDPQEIRGINTFEQLEEAREILATRSGA
jgi:UDP-N-acetylglucosamine pyrophosphorylase